MQDLNRGDNVILV